MTERWTLPSQPGRGRGGDVRKDFEERAGPPLAPKCLRAAVAEHPKVDP
jgi:hypothetical protein